MSPGATNQTHQPTMSFSFCAMVLCVIAALAFYLARPIEVDVFWHLRTGEWIWQNKQIPATDIFLQTHQSTPWVLHEWLPEIAIYLIHRHFGNIGLMVWSSGLTTLIFILFYRHLRCFLPEGLLWKALIFSAALVLPYVTPRPQLVAYILFTVFFIKVFKYLKGQGNRHLWPLPGLMLIWANSHGSFILGPLLLIGLIFASYFDRYFLEHKFLVIKPSFTVYLSWITFLVILAACVNPYGVRIWGFPFAVKQLWVLRHIQEWAPATITNLAHLGTFASLALVVSILTFKKQPPNTSDWVIPCTCILLSLWAGRQSPFAVFAALIFVAPQCTEASWPRISLPFRLPAQLTSALSREAGGKSDFLHLAIALCSIVFVLADARSNLRRQTKEFDSYFGISAINHIKEKNLLGPGLNHYNYGGYFTFALWPSQKAFIDGRPDMYGDEFSKENFKIVNGESGWSKAFDRYGFNYVLMPQNTPIVALLLLRGDFFVHFENDHSVVLVKHQAVK